MARANDPELVIDFEKISEPGVHEQAFVEGLAAHWYFFYNWMKMLDLDKVVAEGIVNQLLEFWKLISDEGVVLKNCFVRLERHFYFYHHFHHIIFVGEKAFFYYHVESNHIKILETNA